MHERQAAENANSSPHNSHGFPSPSCSDLPPPPGWPVKNKPSKQIVEPTDQERVSEACAPPRTLNVIEKFEPRIFGSFSIVVSCLLVLYYFGIACLNGVHACRRRDVYKFNTAVKPMADPNVLKHAAGTIKLDPDAYHEFALKQALRRPLQLHASFIRI